MSSREVDYYTIKMKKKVFNRSVVDVLAADFKWKVKQAVVAFKLKSLKK